MTGGFETRLTLFASEDKMASRSIRIDQTGTLSHNCFTTEMTATDHSGMGIKNHTGLKDR